jgi:cellulose synthase/poly-beta-1,6-N-acetylglucosamine synthase-like glycosyltransferase
MIALAAVLTLLARQLFVLGAIVRSRTFLRTPASRRSSGTPTMFIVIPVLRETAIIAETIKHMEALAEGHLAQVIVVTTERETADPLSSGNTVALVEELAAGGKFVHLHYPDAKGLKGDQVNFAAVYCATTLLGDVPAKEAYVVCYDADSRPPLDSLSHFESAICTNDDASVFHQSSRFELRAPSGDGGKAWLGRLGRAVCDGGALRANRFVLGFELPRLLSRTSRVGRLKRAMCSYVYAHITGHGLCIRLSFLLDHPLPTQSPLEDMQYSFRLGSRDIPMVPVASLDHAAVPYTIAAQVEQASRWFFGPARALRYLREPATLPGVRSRLQAMSALGSAAEWLGCAVVAPVTLVLICAVRGPLQFVAICLALTYAVQLVMTDLALATPSTFRQRVVRVLTCSIATVLFGIGGFIGAVNLLKGGSGIGRTERR